MPGMAIHLVKLCVGIGSLAELAAWQQAESGQEALCMHVTRQTPKRAEELLAGGSLYWVIGGLITARQRLRELRPLVYDGVAHCGLVLEAPLIPVELRPHRPFQGWRYLAADQAPPDRAVGTQQGDPALERELAKLGLV
jgi:hypothetical protein